MFSGLNSFAQYVQAALGDPVVNITFGSGANPGQAVKLSHYKL